MPQDQVVVITHANRPLGLKLAERFLATGARVIATSSTDDTTQLTVAGVGTLTEVIALDPLDPAAYQAVVGQVVRRHGHIDVWVNNPPEAASGPAEHLAPGKWESSLASRVSAAFYASQAAGQQMLAQGHGVIVNIASVAAYAPLQGQVADTVTSAGLVALTEALGIEWARRGVRVVGVAPVLMQTDGLDTSLARRNERLEDYERRSPLRRLARVDEVVEAVAFLTSDSASYITAETLRVDGGWVAYQLF